MTADELPSAGSPQDPSASLQTVSTPDAPAEPGRIELPAFPPVTSSSTVPAFSESRALRNARLDVVLVAMVLAFAFLLASSPAINSDLWLHLAAGRDLLAGRYHFGADPYAHTTEGIYWVNHSWLFDLIAYGLFRTAGGAALVAAKALLIVALAWFLMRLGRVGYSWWLPAVCAALSVLAAAPRLLLQPSCVSFLLLALTLWLLVRPRAGYQSEAPTRGQPAGPLSLAAYWPLLPLFVLWVNLDDWFLLGPLTVAVYALGRVLDRTIGMGSGHPVRPGEIKALSWTLAAGLAACLLNPHPMHAFTLPFPLGVLDEAPALGQDPLISRLLTSPFQEDYIRGALARTPAGLAYFVLVVLSLLSFVPAFVTGRGVSWWRVLLWLALFLLSAYHARTIPFFAIVAGPILALNLGELLGRAAPASAIGPDGILDLRPYTPIWGRALTVVAAVLAVVAAWPGWMLVGPYGPRQWQVVADPSLEGAARLLVQWRQEGKLGSDARAFNTEPDSANYFAWACPDRKGFFDARLNLFARTAGEYMAVRRGLEGMPAKDDPDWRTILRDHKVRLLIVHESSRRSRSGVLRHLLEAPVECPLLYLNGRTAIFGWRDPARSVRQDADPFAGLLYNWKRRAFAPTASDRAPAAWPGREPSPWQWWQAFVRPQAHTFAARDEAASDLIYFQALFPIFLKANAVRCDLTLEAGLLGKLAVPEGGPAGTALTAAVSYAQARLPASQVTARSEPSDRVGLEMRSRILMAQDDGPPELLLLAIRAGRRALHEDPDDPRAHLALGECYRLASHRTRERVWESRWPWLKQLRQVQAVAAFQQALRLDPRLGQARGGLIRLYQEMKANDLALKEMQKLLEQWETDGPRPGETQAKYDERLKPRRREVERMKKQVDNDRDLFEVNAAPVKKVDIRVQLALDKGLMGKALDILMDSNIAVFGIPGMEMELQLLLATGRVGEFRQLSNPQQKEELGLLRYGWMQVQLEAATGDYAEADKTLREMADAIVKSGTPWKNGLSDPQELAVGFASCMLNRSTFLVSNLQQQWVLEHAGSRVDNLRRQADLTVLRAALALEEGRTTEAERLLRDTLSLYNDKAGHGMGLDFPSREAAEQMLAWLTAKK